MVRRQTIFDFHQERLFKRDVLPHERGPSLAKNQKVLSLICRDKVKFGNYILREPSQSFVLLSQSLKLMSLQVGIVGRLQTSLF